MGISKVIYGSQTLFDLTNDTLTNGGQLMAGVTAHNKAGDKITGTFSIDAELAIQANLLSQIQGIVGGAS